jgi:hypothetical protein
MGVSTNRTLMSLEINRPQTVAEVAQAFQRYEQALMANDVATLNELFWNSPHTIRFGLAEQAYGHDAIAGVRAARDPKDIQRTLARIVITTYGTDYATASCEYRRNESGRFGRQMQTWLRTPEGWRVVAAHVTLFDKVLPAFPPSAPARS